MPRLIDMRHRAKAPYGILIKSSSAILYMGDMIAGGWFYVLVTDRNNWFHMEGSTMKKTGIMIVSMLATVLLAACGGGGGGGAPTVTPPPQGAITITTTNAELVSAVVIGSIDTLEGGSSGVGLITGVSVNQGGNGFDFSDFVVSQLGRFDVIRQQQLSSGIVGVAIGPVTELCSDGGSVTISGNVTDTTGTFIYSGDTLSLDFNNCNELGTVFSGGLDLVINAVNPDPYDGVSLPYDLDISVVLRNLFLTEGGITLGSDGDMRLELSEDASGNHQEVLSGSFLVANLNGEAESLTNYNYDLSYNDFTGDYTIVISGSINSTILGGAVTFTTLTPFTGDDFFATGDHPTAGELFMESDSDPSQAILTALSDGINILIEVDTDGNGIYEGMVPTTWATLESL
jgi:hypothetical protein